MEFVNYKINVLVLTLINLLISLFGKIIYRKEINHEMNHFLMKKF